MNEPKITRPIVSVQADAEPIEAEFIDLGEEISDEEANEEIDVGALPATPAPRPVADNTTPSVRIAIDKAADILRELRQQ